jgi:SWI/SNF-related matrix-associated actin-dependent regulator of chromatin subfamily A3
MSWSVSFVSDAELMDQDTLTSSFDVGKIALHPSPPSISDGTLYVNLLPHQSQALQWMIEHENPKLPKTPEADAVQFWKKIHGTAGRSDYWLNAATMTPQQGDPELGKGGIIADGMGLGEVLAKGRLLMIEVRL